MSFTDNFNKIEEVKSKYNSQYLKQKFEMYNSLSDISKVVLDYDPINNRFADLVSDYLSKSDFKVFGIAKLDNEIMYVTDSVGHGDCFSFLYDNKKQIDTLKYQTSKEDTTIVLKKKNNKVFLIKTTNQLDGSYRQIKSTYMKDEDGYYQKSYSDVVVINDDELVTYGSEELEYTKETNTLTKSYSMVTKDDFKVLSKTRISKDLDKSEFVIEEGLFYIINKKDEKEKLLKVKELENKLVNKIN